VTNADRVREMLSLADEMRVDELVVRVFRPS
jgi:hypothetical protein